MSTALIIVGLAFMVVGLIVFLIPLGETPVAQGAIGDIGELIGKVNDLLDRFDKRFRPGLILMLLGLALVALGIFFEAQNAKNAVEAAAVLPPLASL